MKVLKLLIIIGFVVLFFQCHHHDHYVWMEYVETKCADPWQTNEGDPETVVLDAVEDYFSNLDITICQIRMDFDETYAEDCEACVCTSGRIIKVKVNECFTDELVEEGFF